MQITNIIHRALSAYVTHCSQESYPNVAGWFGVGVYFVILSAFSIDMIFILPEILPIFVTLAPFVFWEVRPRNGTNLGIRMLFAWNFKLQAINENKHPISTSHKIQCFLIKPCVFFFARSLFQSTTWEINMENE